jgi:hypothetical protein
MLFLPNTLLKYGLLSASGAFNYPFPCAMFLIGILPFVLAITDNEISLFYMISGYIGIFFLLLLRAECCCLFNTCNWIRCIYMVQKKNIS